MAVRMWKIADWLGVEIGKPFYVNMSGSLQKVVLTPDGLYGFETPIRLDSVFVNLLTGRAQVIYEGRNEKYGLQNRVE